MADEKEYKPVTAEDALAPHMDVTTEESLKRAEEAGVVAPEYVDYSEALHNYESRSDVEPLSERRAREVGSDFRDASFRREAGEEEGGVITSDKTKGVSAEPKVTEKETKKK
jgi:hypothetical protein